MYKICTVLATLSSATEHEFEYEQYSVLTGQTRHFNGLHTGDIERSEVDYWSDPVSQGRSRIRREIFDTDTRFPIKAGSSHVSEFPFDTVVKLNTGCSGILISKKHVLTAAHCVHDGLNYHQSLKRLRVGTLRTPKDKSRNKTNLRTKRGRKNVARTRRSPDMSENDNELNFFTPYRRQSRRNDRSKNSRRKRQGKGANGMKGKDKPAMRLKLRKERKSFKWIRATLINIPNSWKKNSSDTVQNVEHDYAVIELTKPASEDYMRVTVSPELENLMPSQRVHFSGFDQKQSDRLAYRFCMVDKQTRDLIYNKCDSMPGSSGAGMYVRYYVPEMKKWQRKIIGVFAGSNKDTINDNQHYNIGMRITPKKFVSICFWVHGEQQKCDKMRDEQLLRRPYVKDPKISGL